MSIDDLLADEAVELARSLLAASLADESSAERRRRRRLGRLLADPAGRELILALTDQVLRIEHRSAAARAFRETVRAHPTTATGPVDAALLRLGAVVAPLVPALVMPLVERRIRAETRGIVLPADDPAFGEHIARRSADGFGLNVNPLGEAILSDEEADARLATVLAMIARPDVDYVSVKVSSIVANLDVLAFDHSVDRIADRLRRLYRAGADHTFVNLDMEEYRDLELTIESFLRVLSEPEFVAMRAGIVLQAYLPDAHGAADRLAAWARARRHDHPGSGRIKIRVVKGANLAMESVEAELHGWVAAPYPTKHDVDASYKALLDTLLDPALAGVVDVGVASHNLFDVAWALLRTNDPDLRDRVSFEMLEGMAPAQSRTVRRRIAAAADRDIRGQTPAVTHASELLMYSPVVAAADFEASIAYLSRRLDENTQADNFLRALFTLTPDSEEFDRQAAMFRRAVTARHHVDTARRRRPLHRADRSADRFENEPETDLTDPAARAAIADALERHAPPTVEVIDSSSAVDSIVDTALAASRRDHPREVRAGWLLAVADVMREQRFVTLAAMAHENGKTIHEGDPEVSEAIDFCEYYARVGAAALDDLATAGYGVAGRGVVAVVAPWNFPYAIPAGGVAAAIAAGNAVVLKPAPEAVEVGALLAEQFWAAGVPRDVLQLVVCDDGPVGRRLVSHPSIDTIVLTGSLATAGMFLDWCPQRRLLGETSGKNALVITAAADIDDAITDLVRSAFGHAGQKCSAASLAIVEASVYDSATFLPRLRDAVRSLRVGAATDLSTMMGPLIGAPGEALHRALTTLEPGEHWLVAPRPIGGDGDLRERLWTPGVRTGVRAGSWFHRTECFGPVLGVMRAEHLDDAIELQNATDYGLTAGLHSLDAAEIDLWLDRVEAGNVYVNRHTTGAVVQRQPFGGWKRSRVGGGAKAGGPGYVTQFARVTDPMGPTDEILDRARASYAQAWTEEFAVGHDRSGLRSESNVLRYVPVTAVAVRHAGEDPTAVELIRLAATVAGVALVESDGRAESELDFVGRASHVERVRVLTPLTDDTRRELHRSNIAVDDDPPVSAGSVELRRWVREQAISQTQHRHGRLTARKRLTEDV